MSDQEERAESNPEDGMSFGQALQLVMADRGIGNQALAGLIDAKAKRAEKVNPDSDLRGITRVTIDRHRNDHNTPREDNSSKIKKTLGGDLFEEAKAIEAAEAVTMEVEEKGERKTLNYRGIIGFAIKKELEGRQKKQECKRPDNPYTVAGFAKKVRINRATLHKIISGGTARMSTIRRVMKELEVFQGSIVRATAALLSKRGHSDVACLLLSGFKEEERLAPNPPAELEEPVAAPPPPLSSDVIAKPEPPPPSPSSTPETQTDSAGRAALMWALEHPNKDEKFLDFAQALQKARPAITPGTLPDAILDACHAVWKECEGVYRAQARGGGVVSVNVRGARVRAQATPEGGFLITSGFQNDPFLAELGAPISNHLSERDASDREPTPGLGPYMRAINASRQSTGRGR